MMTRNRSSRIVLAKYTLVAPLFTILIILFVRPKNGLLAKTEDFSKQIESKIDGVHLETGTVINQNEEIFKPNSFQNNDTLKIINQDSVINPIDENTPIVQDFLKNSELYDVPPSYSVNTPIRSTITQVPERNQIYFSPASFKDDPQVRLAGRTGGTISQWSFKNQTLLSIIQSASSNRSACAIQSFSLIRKPFNKSESPRQSNNSGARFSTYTQDLITLAQNGDVYEFRNIKGRCPGDAIARDIGTMSFVIGENISEVSNNSKSQVLQPFPPLNGLPANLIVKIENGGSGGLMNIENFKKQNALNVTQFMQEPNVQWRIKEFSVQRVSKLGVSNSIRNQGNTFNSDVKTLINQAETGDIFHFIDIIISSSADNRLGNWGSINFTLSDAFSYGIPTLSTGKMNGLISKRNIQIASLGGLILKDSKKFRIYSFKMNRVSLDKNETSSVENNGASFSGDSKKLMNTLDEGDNLIIDNLKVVDSEGKIIGINDKMSFTVDFNDINSNLSKFDKDHNNIDSASFIGGKSAFFKFLGQNIKYPKEIKERNIEGIVTANFIVEKDGSIRVLKPNQPFQVDVVEYTNTPLVFITISKPKGVQIIENNNDSILLAEIERVLSIMPKWKPAIKNGKYLSTKISFPIKFKTE